MHLFIDTETTGLIPMNKNTKKIFEPEFLKEYEKARLVSICLILCDSDGIEKKRYYEIIKPNNFIIPQVVIDIHGITNEIAQEDGKDIMTIFENIKEYITDSSIIVAHNILFDINILLSELIRNEQFYLINEIKKKTHICTVKLTRYLDDKKRYKKLSFVYNMLFNEKQENCHNALYDTIHCYKIFFFIKKNKNEYYKKYIKYSLVNFI